METPRTGCDATSADGTPHTGWRRTEATVPYLDTNSRHDPKRRHGTPLLDDRRDQGFQHLAVQLGTRSAAGGAQATAGCSGTKSLASSAPNMAGAMSTNSSAPLPHATQRAASRQHG